jgi:proton-coupled amino acid transporter
VVVASVALIPLVWLRSLEKLAASALLANASILFGVGTVLYFDIQTDLEPHGDRGLVAADWSNFPLYYGSAVFSMEGIALVLPIENAMAEPEKFGRVLRNGCIGITFLLSGFGTFCYVSFGDKTADLITSNLPAESKMVLLMQVFYCVSLFFTYPIMLFPCLQVIETLGSCNCCTRGYAMAIPVEDMDEDEQEQEQEEEEEQEQEEEEQEEEAAASSGTAANFC